MRSHRLSWTLEKPAGPPVDRHDSVLVPLSYVKEMIECLPLAAKHNNSNAYDKQVANKEIVLKTTTKNEQI